MAATLDDFETYGGINVTYETPLTPVFRWIAVVRPK